MGRANAAYYANHDPFRDFTTAPEITQVFGELLGAWAAIVWDQIGRPDRVLFAECGPGRGTLMQDARRATQRVAPAFHRAACVRLIETSPRLRAQQAQRVPDATWHDRVEQLPDGPLILLANEFLDALPIRQFVGSGADWTERWVKDGAFEEAPAAPPFGWGRGEVPAPCTGPEIHEVNEAAEQWARHVSARLVAQGGVALVLDYGPARSGTGSTLQALKGGRPADPLSSPGDADLTAHVDFERLATVARAAGAGVHGPLQQGPFLARLGLFQRTGALARSQAPARAAALIHAAQRLAEPDRMGGLFKAMAVCQPGLSSLPGFEP